MELKNYINVRVQSHNNDKIIGVMKHNLRNIKSLNQENNDINFFYDFDNNKWLEMNNVNKKNEYQKLSKKFKQDREEHTNLNMKKNGRNIQDKRQGSLFEGVFTFSEKIKEDLGNKYSLKDLQQVSLSSLEQIAAKYKTQIRGLYLHMDETTPHFHFLMRNFNDEDMSLYFKNKNKKFLSELQDLVFENFKILGMKRGQKKEITKKTYKTTKRHKEELETQLKDLKRDFEFEELENKDIKEIIHNVRDFLNKEKNDNYKENLKLEIKEELIKTTKNIEVYQGVFTPNKKISYTSFSQNTFENLYNFFDKKNMEILQDSFTMLKVQHNEKKELKEKIKEKDIEITKLKELDPNKILEEKNKELENSLYFYKTQILEKTQRIENIKEKEEKYNDLKMDYDSLKEKHTKQEEKILEQEETIKEQNNFIEQIYQRVLDSNLFNYFTNIFKREETKPKNRMTM
ncbi:plasmid recombination protein [Arcobacter sp. CECT 9188]|uniref:plasmid recombination protein n=1 Tax=Arcobacter sp. CECT 9188 TaxID=2044505 RepID=UPI000DE99884|nr:plasmid recombination protein [Arcobacter sp. CECT 9188]RBQ26932.1 hypothetical protein CRU88_04135 [Arcobacter sp. CECT 9188]